MKLSRATLLATLTLVIALWTACERATGVPGDELASSEATQKTPFDRGEGSRGISPSNSLVPGARKIPEGTPITIRLQDPVSSTSSKAGDTFEGTLDDPIVIEGQAVVSRGAGVTGKVLAAKASGGLQSPGYLRIALVSIKAEGQPVVIETSSLFVKGGSRERRNLAMIGGGKGALIKSAVGGGGGGGAASATGKKEVSFGVETRLTFRLAQVVELH
jgi:hypothetical protein